MQEVVRMIEDMNRGDQGDGLRQSSNDPSKGFRRPHSSTRVQDTTGCCHTLETLLERGKENTCAERPHVTMCTKCVNITGNKVRL
ncbi:hypothetical protein NC651_016334 [Populus alba x Populus x berolinensis]|nr:hypothetical protein NC651_016334 [Populus alba x Populus x berolinensis]